MAKSLAIKYRPATFDDVTEQGAIKQILSQQLNEGDMRNAYLFCGPAGCGKTTLARIFANELNKGQGNPIEMDAASNSGVDDVRGIIEQAKTKSLDSEYKVFIIDEAHSISNTGWQAFLKLIEEPPAKTIFIFATTDPQKIPKTILSRVQRYNIQKISQKGIVDRLKYILDTEYGADANYSDEGIEYIAKLAEGGMRDAITYLDKCLAYSKSITIQNVVVALGVADYDVLFDLVDAICDKKQAEILKIIEDIHMSGKDLKQFVKTFMNFLLDLSKYSLTKSYEYLNIPSTYSKRISAYDQCEFDIIQNILKSVIRLNADIKWETSPKSVIEATLVFEVNGIGKSYSI